MGKVWALSKNEQPKPLADDDEIKTVHPFRMLKFDRQNPKSYHNPIADTRL